ncbi:uncharacterized protein (DUF302 family) [Streptacidiphilus sp. MAP12-16]|uniref:DUF302 domain-containing protein n=1 Tax=Streptacidiphilus sp. MAP12-16 TaxID=3156300 RepID=UPI003515E967
MVDAVVMTQDSEGTGLVTVASPFSVADTVNRLEREIEASGLALFAVVDHGSAARGIGVPMRETQLLVFGNPRVGTAAMTASRLFALELPLRALVWADGRGGVWVSYQDVRELGRRYGVPDALMQPLNRVPELVSTAVGPV